SGSGVEGTGPAVAELAAEAGILIGVGDPEQDAVAVVVEVERRREVEGERHGGIGPGPLWGEADLPSNGPDGQVHAEHCPKLGRPGAGGDDHRAGGDASSLGSDLVS